MERELLAAIPTTSPLGEGERRRWRRHRLSTASTRRPRAGCSTAATDDEFAAPPSSALTRQPDPAGRQCVRRTPDAIPSRPHIMKEGAHNSDELGRGNDRRRGARPDVHARELAQAPRRVPGLLRADKATEARCPGVATLIYVRASGGEPLIAGRTVTGFTHIDEDFADGAMPDVGALPHGCARDSSADRGRASRAHRPSAKS